MPYDARALAALLADLATRQLLVVTGKGGVGKTTVAVALGCGARRRRPARRWCSRSTRARTPTACSGVPPSGGEIVTGAPRLLLQNLRPRAVLDQLVREQVRIGPVVRRVLASEVYRHFAEGAPGFKELAILGHALRLVRGLERVGGAAARGGRARGATAKPDVDLVVLDAPATGHGLSLLLAPRLTAATVGQGPFGRMAGELAALVDDPARTGVVVAAAAEEMPMQEALESLARLRGELGREAQAVVVNGLFPPSRQRRRRAARRRSGRPAVARPPRGPGSRARAACAAAWQGPQRRAAAAAARQRPGAGGARWRRGWRRGEEGAA